MAVDTIDLVDDVETAEVNMSSAPVLPTGLDIIYGPALISLTNPGEALTIGTVSDLLVKVDAQVFTDGSVADLTNYSVEFAIVRQGFMESDWQEGLWLKITNALFSGTYAAILLSQSFTSTLYYGGYQVFVRINGEYIGEAQTLLFVYPGTTTSSQSGSGGSGGGSGGTTPSLLPLFSLVGFANGDGLSPSYKLVNTAGTTLIDWTSSGIVPVGGGSGDYFVSIPRPTGFVQGVVYWRDNLSGGETKADGVS